MDKATFGDSQAAQNLVTSMLNNPDYASYKSRATRILAKWFEYSSAVMGIQNKTIRLGILTLERKHFLTWIDKADFPKVMKTHMCNVIVGQHRRLINESRNRPISSNPKI